MPHRPPDDPAALAGRLYDQYGASLYRYALMLLANASVAEDAVQQVFASLLKGLRGRQVVVRNDVHYLRRAIRNECYSMLRRSARHADNESDRRSESSALLEPLADAGTAPEERLALDYAMRGLSADHREVLHLHVYEGLTFQEVADTTGESINTVASRYRAALTKLRNALT